MEQFLTTKLITCIWGPNMSSTHRHLHNSSIGLNERSNKYIRKIMPISMALFQKEQDQNAGAKSESDEASAQAFTDLAADLTNDRAETGYKYLFAAVAPTLAIATLAAGAAYAVYLRFIWQMQENSELPWVEIFGTFFLAVGAAVATELWAGWVHQNLWHGSFWGIHESHHRPRKGLLELNDVFYITNAIPAIILMTFGILHKGLISGLCFGVGLGITICGITYMFVHDGVLHGRFPVGPIANVPFFQKVRAAHQAHHANLFNGVPFGILFGAKELEEVYGLEELEKLLNKVKSRS